MMACGGWVVSAGVAAAMVVGALLLPAPGFLAQAEPPVPSVADGAITPAVLPPWAPPASPAEVALGEKLFFERRLSRDDRFACSTCHDLDAAGTDSRTIGEGIDGKPLRRNTLTVFNAGLSATLGWTGAFSSLESQAMASIAAPAIMGADWREVIAKLQGDAGYRADFAAVYGAGPTPVTIARALAAFQRTLVTPGSRFDRYLEGEETALTPSELAGYRLFREIGCISCHQGRNIGGNLFEQFGLFIAPGAGGKQDDPGRQEVTGRAADRNVFRVPSLRNVALTPPYFHDGSAETLGRAVTVMARTQLGRSLDPADIDRIVQFLGTLTGEYQGRPLRAAGAPQE